MRTPEDGTPVLPAPHDDLGGLVAASMSPDDIERRLRARPSTRAVSRRPKVIKTNPPRIEFDLVLTDSDEAPIPYVLVVAELARGVYRMVDVRPGEGEG